MSADPDRDRLRQTFDQAAELYQRARPEYPDELFDDLVARTALVPGDRLLEIGCATGKATVPLAKRGYRPFNPSLDSTGSAGRSVIQPFSNEKSCPLTRDVEYPEGTMGDLSAFVHSDPDILGGTPVFIGTRVPLRNLIDYLEGDYSVEEFLAQFPSVTRDQVNGALEALASAIPRARPA